MMIVLGSNTAPFLQTMFLLCVTFCVQELTNVIDDWFGPGTFPLPGVWEKLIKSKIHAAKSEKWRTVCVWHPKFGLAGAAFTHISSYQYWSLSFDYPYLVKHFHLQVPTV